MQSFLEKTVALLCSKYGEAISDLCIVLPNRRAGLFLKTHFAKNLRQTFWAPEIIATEDFVGLLAELEIADSITLLFELYETIKAVSKEEPPSFEEFSKWGQILLSDINEIDSYLVDAKQLFGNLKDIKELESWSLNSEEGLSDFQKQYLNFWKSLGTYYFDFKKRLLSKKQAYQGMAFQMVAENVEERIQKHPWKKIIFVGFNALNKAEEQIIGQLLNIDKAEIIWDTDNYYVNDSRQEAGKFIRKYREKGTFLKKLNSDLSAENNTEIAENLLETDAKNITVIGVAKNVAQAKVAGELVANFKKEDDLLQNSALVLADENLLFPVLHSLPSDIQDINVTMGYPLKNTPLAGYFELLIHLHLNGLKLSNGKENYSFYHKDLINLLSHPYTSILLQNKKEKKDFSVQFLIKAIQDKNIVFAGFNSIHKILLSKHPQVIEVLKPLFDHWKTPDDAINCLNQLIDAIKNSLLGKPELEKSNKANLEMEYLFAFSKICKRIQALQTEYPQSVENLKTFQSLFKKIVGGVALPFYGEPLMGLQVMGMLETRTLDFENIIILSCNEDILPSGKSTNSFIPYELKKYFGLPTYSDKDAIFAFHFYRLIQRAKNIFLVYNTESDALGSGEKSRYLTQLIHELLKVNKKVKIKELLLNIPLKIESSDSPISIEKTDAILKILKAKAAKGFSPSLLNTYRNCSLQFYFQTIAGLKEADEVEETIGADTLGNAIHEVLEIVFQPFIGKKLSVEDIEGMKKQVEPLTLASFEKNYSKHEISLGKNYLTLTVALKFLNNFLKEEIKNLKELEKNGKPLIIKSLEEKLETNIFIDGLEVKVHGKADRIDSVGAYTRIVDYKTGLADDKELRFSDWEELQVNSDLAKSFQLLMYAYMYQKMNPAIIDKMLSGIITFRELSKGLKPVKVNSKELLDVAILQKFEEQLEQLLSGIFNQQKNFDQTSNIENCKYCSFKGICNR